MTSVATVGNSTAISSAATFVARPENYSITDIVLAFFKEKSASVFKTAGYAAFWTDKVVTDLPPNVRNFSLMMGDIKDALSAIEVPEKAYTLWQGLKGLWTDCTNKDATWGKVGTTAKKSFKDATSLTNSVCDGIGFGSKYIPIEKDTLTMVKGVNFAATLAGAGVGAAEQVHNLTTMPEADSKKSTFYMINLARDVSYVAVGALGLYFILTATPIVPWMLVACLTSGLSFTIGGFFYERIVDPENKGKNLNPAIVAENVLNQRRRATSAASAA